MKNQDFLKREELENFLIQSGIRIDDYVITAMDVSTEVHDGIRSLLDGTHDQPAVARGNTEPSE